MNSFITGNKDISPGALDALETTIRTIKLGGSVNDNMSKELASKELGCNEQTTQLKRLFGQRADINDNQFPKAPSEEEVDQIWRNTRAYISWLVGPRETRPLPSMCFAGYVGYAIEDVAHGRTPDNELSVCIQRHRKALRSPFVQRAMLSALFFRDVFQIQDPIFAEQYSYGTMKLYEMDRAIGESEPTS